MQSVWIEVVQMKWSKRISSSEVKQVKKIHSSSSSHLKDHQNLLTLLCFFWEEGYPPTQQNDILNRQKNHNTDWVGRTPNQTHCPDIPMSWKYWHHIFIFICILSCTLKHAWWDLLAWLCRFHRFLSRASNLCKCLSVIFQTFNRTWSPIKTLLASQNRVYNATVYTISNNCHN